LINIENSVRFITCDSKLASGIYFIKISLKNGDIKFKKLVVE
jgi:hypothetical protein